jgi:arylsulfatase A-like enzyme
VTPPDIGLTSASDPDASFRIGCAYAAQVMVLDGCWKALMEALTATDPDKQWWVVLLGVRGYPLGEHRQIGGVDDRSYGEQLHVPWLIRCPDGRGALARSHALTTHLDLLPSLADLVHGGIQDLPGHLDGMSIQPLISTTRVAWRDWLLSISPTGSKSLRTATWCLRQAAGANTGASDVAALKADLYVRPDDRWEANDVAKLCPDVVEQLGRAMEELSLQIDQGGPLPTSVRPADAPTCQ